MKVVFRVPVTVAFLLLSLPSHADASPSSTHNKDAQIQKAIQMCRDKLAKDPDFPKALHMLGMLLESESVSPSIVDDDPSSFDDASRFQHLEEIATSFWKAGIGEENSLDDSTRIDSLLRGASHFLKISDVAQASACYRKALDLTIVNLKEESGILESILQEATPTLLSSLSSVRSLDDETILLAQRLLERFPNQPLVHQFQGAVMRKTGRISEAHQAYHTATALLQQQHGESGFDPVQWIQSCILAAASAREAGLPEAAQMAYLKPAEEILQSGSKDIPLEVQSDLYNNMGIVQKKAGKTHAAIAFFQRATLANPGDGHALAHLASLGVDVSSTKSFDPDYVQGLFNGYAARFEDELVQDLNYKGHQMVVDALKSWWAWHVLWKSLMWDVVQVWQARRSKKIFSRISTCEDSIYLHEWSSLPVRAACKMEFGCTAVFDKETQRSCLLRNQRKQSISLWRQTSSFTLAMYPQYSRRPAIA